MAYESMKTEDLKKELFRRIEDIDSWANETNIEKTKNDISDELDKGDKFNEQLDEKVNKCIKKCRIFSILAIVSFVLSAVSFLLVFILNLNIEISIAFSFLTLIFSSFVKCDVDLRNEHQERANILYWYYCLMQEASIKQIYKKTYEDSYKVVEKLCEDKSIKSKIEKIKKELGIDFSYLNKK